MLTHRFARTSHAMTETNPRSASAMIDEGNALEEQGRISEAMARYDAGARADPLFARAHLNRGNIFLGANQFDEARRAYQLAISCDPNYAAAHFNLGNLDYRARDYHRALDNYQIAISLRPDFADAFVARANALDSLGRTADAIESYERALAIDPGYAEVHFNLGLLTAAQERYEDAAKSLRGAIAIRPDYGLAYYQLGRVLQALGRSAEAIEQLRHAVRIEPTIHEAHYNLGIALQRLRPDPPLEEAASCLRRAAELKPDFAQAHHILGIVQSYLGQLDAAEASLRRAFAIEPASADILHDLALMLQSSEKSEEAVQLIVPMLHRTPTWKIKSAFASCVATSRFTTDDAKIRAALTIAISEPWGMPYELCLPALKLVMLNRAIADGVRLANEAWPARLPKTALFGADCVVALESELLLHALLAAAPVRTVEFERFLTCVRHALLEISSGQNSIYPTDTEPLQFYAALSRQCFINEYIFDCDDKEVRAAVSCREKLLALLDSGEMVPPVLLVTVAAYFPLHTLSGAKRLLAARYVDPVDAVLRQQIREPLEEQLLRVDVKSLTSITAGVSEEVRGQYEQNPYPRWVNLPKSDLALHFNDELRRALPLATFTLLPDDSAPEVLIAGCGTGSQPILFVQRFRGARVLAIDLSLSSIGYAKRKTQELGITNIEYAQADILKFGSVSRTFDIIESVGVLHHLAEPFAGWRTLLSRLRPGGFMGLGFYSELARRHIVRTREIIAGRGYASTPSDIRRFRQDPILHASAELEFLTMSPDFYSTSECRDLLFHVHEKRLTLEQIESFIAQSGLRFIGFELDAGILRSYRARFTDDQSASNLRNWARFEADHPDTFGGMYRFWIQKPMGTEEQAAG
jgi:tetratricopeptide (TPR) repeat protein/2-polyprenyl-3-methyl-5-hydroxy-6-metoxy-1,4-benzoquinol methylase